MKPPSRSPHETCPPGPDFGFHLPSCACAPCQVSPALLRPRRVSPVLLRPLPRFTCSAAPPFPRFTCPAAPPFSGFHLPSCAPPCRVSPALLRPLPGFTCRPAPAGFDLLSCAPAAFHLLCCASLPAFHLPCCAPLFRVSPALLRPPAGFHLPSCAPCRVSPALLRPLPGFHLLSCAPCRVSPALLCPLFSFFFRGLFPQGESLQAALQHSRSTLLPLPAYLTWLRLSFFLVHCRLSLAVTSLVKEYWPPHCEHFHNWPKSSMT